MNQIRQFKYNDRFISLLVYKFPLGKCGGVTDACKDHKGKEVNNDI